MLIKKKSPEEVGLLVELRGPIAIFVKHTNILRGKAEGQRMDLKRGKSLIMIHPDHVKDLVETLREYPEVANIYQVKNDEARKAAGY